MQLEMFSILDVKAGSFAQPFFAVNIAVACRNVESFIGQGNSTVASFPGDFALYHLGTFDDASGTIVPLSPVVCIAQCSQLVKRG